MSDRGPARRRLLLLSSSRHADHPYLAYALPMLRALLGGEVRTVAFVPWAGVTVTYDDYAERVRAPFAEAGYELLPVHEGDDPAAVVRRADAVAVGGGNTFRLLERLRATGLLPVIRERVAAGAPYVGWSAGSVVACPTLRTTNDMPIVDPGGFDALGLVPFQINAHFTEAHPPGFHGETRAQRIAELGALHPDTWVVGLPEGTALRVDGDRVSLLGEAEAVVFRGGREVRRVSPGEALDWLPGAGGAP